MGYKPQDGQNIAVLEVTIPAGASESEAFPTHGMTPLSVFMPAAWTDAQIAILGSLTGADDTFVAPKSLGQAVQYAVGQGEWVALLNDKLVAPYMCVKSVDGDGAAVNQAAARTLTLVMARYLS